jgi:hypothetical protein
MGVLATALTIAQILAAAGATAKTVQQLTAEEPDGGPSPGPEPVPPEEPITEPTFRKFPIQGLQRGGRLRDDLLNIVGENGPEAIIGDEVIPLGLGSGSRGAHQRVGFNQPTTAGAARSAMEAILGAPPQRPVISAPPGGSSRLPENVLAIAGLLLPFLQQAPTGRGRKARRRAFNRNQAIRGVSAAATAGSKLVGAGRQAKDTKAKAAFDAQVAKAQEDFEERMAAFKAKQKRQIEAGKPTSTVTIGPHKFPVTSKRGEAELTTNLGFPPLPEKPKPAKPPKLPPASSAKIAKRNFDKDAKALDAFADRVRQHPLGPGKTASDAEVEGWLSGPGDFGGLEEPPSEGVRDHARAASTLRAQRKTLRFNVTLSGLIRDAIDAKSIDDARDIHERFNSSPFRAELEANPRLAREIDAMGLRVVP